MIVEIALPVVAFTVSPGTIRFGTIAPGKTSTIDIALKNTGTIAIEVAASIEQIGDKPTALCEKNLYLGVAKDGSGGELAKDYTTMIAKGKSATIRAQLRVPKGWPIGTE